MQKFAQFLSYLLAVVVGFAIALAAMIYLGLPVSKLDRLEALLADRFIGEFDRTAVEDAASYAMVDALGDRWSYYIPAAEYAAHQEQLDNAYVGIGVTVSPAPEGFEIISLQENGSAEAAGLLVGDKITSADGISTDSMSTEDLRNIVRGKEGTTVALDILRGEETLNFVVTRTQILTPVVNSELLEGNVGLIAIANFDARCASEAIEAIEALQQQGAQSLLFDVRFNPGGYAYELVQLLDYLLPEGELFRTLDYTGKETVDLSDARCLDMPMAVLCNEDSYSAAEFFAAAIQEYDAGIVVGTPTCGKGYFQVTYQLPDGSAVGVSIGKYFTPKGNSLIDAGVQPDVLVEVDDETYANIYYGVFEPQEDPQIQAALAALQSK